jgi:DNA-binding PadR family transcriptional regulator
MDDGELLKGSGQMLVLAVLRDGPLHGYGIAREIERRCGGALTFKEGSLYPALHTLERDGFIRGAWETAPASGRERRVYTLTEAGAGALERRRRTWEAFQQAARQILGEEKGDGNATEDGSGGARSGAARRRGGARRGMEPV